jgi:hypothetical protein
MHADCRKGAVIKAVTESRACDSPMRSQICHRSNADVLGVGMRAVRDPFAAVHRVCDSFHPCSVLRLFHLGTRSPSPSSLWNQFHISALSHSSYAGQRKRAWMAEYLTDLALERLVKYEQRAAHAHKCAVSAESPEVRDFYIGLAMAWEALVSELRGAPLDPNGVADIGRPVYGPSR